MPPEYPSAIAPGAANRRPAVGVEPAEEGARAPRLQLAEPLVGKVPADVMAEDHRLHRARRANARRARLRKVHQWWLRRWVHGSGQDRVHLPRGCCLRESQRAPGARGGPPRSDLARRPGVGRPGRLPSPQRRSSGPPSPNWKRSPSRKAIRPPSARSSTPSAPRPTPSGTRRQHPQSTTRMRSSRRTRPEAAAARSTNASPAHMV